jgi:hypothetical protein
MDDRSGDSGAVVYIEAPRHSRLKRIHDYWIEKRGSRGAPSRADINPVEIKSVLPDIMIWNVETGRGQYTIRLVGENIVRFVGHNNTGQSATVGMPDEAASTMIRVLDQVVETRAPHFRAGKAFWHREKNYRDFEACYLPLSADGSNVDMILGGAVFDTLL